MRSVRCLFWALLLAVVPAAASAQGLSYLHNGRPIPLQYSEEYLSMRHAAPASGRRAGPATTATSVGPQGLAEYEVVPSVTLLGVQPLAPPSGKAAGPAAVAIRRQALHEVRQGLLTDPAVAWVYPALVHPPSGQLVLPTNEIIVKVRAGVDPAAGGGH